MSINIKINIKIDYYLSFMQEKCPDLRIYHPPPPEGIDLPMLITP